MELKPTTNVMNKANQMLRSVKIVEEILSLESSLKNFQSQMNHTYYNTSCKVSGITEETEKLLPDGHTKIVSFSHGRTATLRSSQQV